ncbi:hypothetical protein GQ457_16G010840 [Hibiscus cannabinus]
MGDAAVGLVSNYPPIPSVKDTAVSHRLDSGTAKASFHDMLLGNRFVEVHSRQLEDLDVEVTEADVRLGGDGVLPEIMFSDKVHDAIDVKLAHSIIVRLLGKSIGYRALLNRICSLWNPSGEMCLIDLDNEFYLVRFAHEDDFTKVLAGGPWTNSSRLWEGICDTWDELKENICWHFRDGVNTDFWYDHWLGSDNRLVFLCTAPVTPSPVVVCDMVDNYGNWGWACLSSLIPQDVLDRVVAIPPPSVALGQDLPGWRWEQNHCFSIKSAYSALDTDVYPVHNFNWKLVWSIQLPQRIKVFLWLAAHDRLFTNVERKRRRNLRLVGLKRTSNSWAAVGGVIRDAYGCWIYGRARSIGRSSVLMVELWVAHDILIAAWDMGFRHVQFETDNSEVALILQGCSVALSGCSLVDSILLLLARPWSVHICHIPRSQNLVADKVVALCRGSSFGSMIFYSVPVELAELVRQEADVG